VLGTVGIGILLVVSIAIVGFAVMIGVHVGHV
jgi:hypothetical protein